MVEAESDKAQEAARVIRQARMQMAELRVVVNHLENVLRDQDHEVSNE